MSSIISTMIKKILTFLMLLVVMKSLVDGRVFSKQDQVDGRFVSKQDQQDINDLEEQMLQRPEGVTDEPKMPRQSALSSASDGNEPVSRGKHPNIVFLAIHVPETVSLADKQDGNPGGLPVKKRFHGYDRNALLHSVNRLMARRYGYFDTLASNLIKK